MATKNQISQVIKAVSTLTNVDKIATEFLQSYLGSQKITNGSEMREVSDRISNYFNNEIRVSDIDKAIHNLYEINEELY